MKYQTGHSTYPMFLILAVAGTMIVTLAALGLGVASIWIESVRVAAAWAGVACGVLWVYIIYNIFDEEVREYLRDIGP